jgi:hypothetical protein
MPSPLSILVVRKGKKIFYSNKKVVSTWEKCSNVFLARFFPLGKTNALGNKIGFDETIMAWRSGLSSKASIMG